MELERAGIGLGERNDWRQ